MIFTKSSPLYSVRCSAYSNYHQGCWAPFEFVNNKNLNGVVVIFFAQGNTFLTPYFYFRIYFIPHKLNWWQNLEKLFINREI